MDSQSEPIENEIATTSCGLPLTHIPEVISVDEAENSKYISRNYEEETIPNTVVFQNSDGTGFENRENSKEILIGEKISDS